MGERRGCVNDSGNIVEGMVIIPWGLVKAVKLIKMQSGRGYEMKVVGLWAKVWPHYEKLGSVLCMVTICITLLHSFTEVEIRNE